MLPTMSTGAIGKEVSEFRSLLQTVLSCLKAVLYCMVAFHTNRGLQAPVSCACTGADGKLVLPNALGHPARSFPSPLKLGAAGQATCGLSVVS